MDSNRGSQMLIAGIMERFLGYFVHICARDYINDVNQLVVLIRKDLSFITKL